MSHELLINVTPTEQRVAVIENGTVNEVFIERTAKRGLVGNIYKGKVVRVLPGMQAAFIEIGLSRTAFLHLNDMVEYTRQSAKTSITDFLQAGRTVTVQIIKDMLGNKGARLTTDLSIPSRYLVFMPYSQYLGISQKIEDAQERERLRIISERLQKQHQLSGGMIVRTAAEHVSESELEQDMLYLVKLWQYIQQTKVHQIAPALVFEDLPLPQRIIRDFSTENTEKVYVDSRELFHQLQQFIETFVPVLNHKLLHYPGEKPLFDLYNVEHDLHLALHKRIDLASGGYLLIDQTEAMTTIDVNTGSYVGQSNLEDTVFKTNMEATLAIARQLRLRNLGGIIIIDFIDMQEHTHRQHVMQQLEKALANDRAKTKITQVSELGLVEMTRKRTRESLEGLLCEPCPHCAGRGYLKTAETVCYEIFRELMRYARTYETQTQFTVIAHQHVIDRLLTQEAQAVADLAHFLHRIIKFQVETAYSQEQYDIYLS